MNFRTARRENDGLISAGDGAAAKKIFPYQDADWKKRTKPQQITGDSLTAAGRRDRMMVLHEGLPCVSKGRSGMVLFFERS